MANGAGLMFGFSEGAKSFLDSYVKMRSLRSQEEKLEQDKMARELDDKYKQSQMQANDARLMADMTTKGYTRSGNNEWMLDPEYKKAQEKKELREVVGSGLREIKDAAGNFVGYERNPDDPKNKMTDLDQQEKRAAIDLKKAQAKAYANKLNTGANSSAARQTPFGLANTTEDAKKIKDAYESKKIFDNKITEMIGLREKHGGGTVLNREDVARGRQLSKDLLLEYKNMAKLGVLSGADEAIINAIIPPDPLEYKSPLSSATGQDPVLNNLKKFKEDADFNFKTKIDTRIQQPSEAGGLLKPALEIGTIRNGYRFKGGNAKSKESWEKVE